MTQPKERSLVLNSLGVQTLLAGRELALTLPWKGDEPTEPLRPLEDLFSSAKRGRPVCVWGHDLPPAGPSHGTLEYRDGTRRELRVERVRTWTPPWQPGEVAWVKETLKRKPFLDLFGNAQPGREVACFAADDDEVTTYGQGYDPQGFDILPWWKGPTLPAARMTRDVSRLTVEVAEVWPERGEGGWRWVTVFRRVEP